jgi:mono/diheme cytochrome c family protein
MRSVVFCFVLMLMAVSGWAQAPPGTTSPGERTFQSYCSNCHSTGRSAGIGPGLYHVLKSKRLSEPQVRKIIKNGKDAMPPVGQQLTQKQMNGLIAFLKGL